MRILVVGEHAEIRNLVMMVLQRAGHQVVASTDVDAVVADGTPLALSVAPVGIPVVALTCDRCLYERRLLEAGCRAIVPKPFDVEQLLAAVRLAGRVVV